MKFFYVLAVILFLVTIFLSSCFLRYRKVELPDRALIEKVNVERMKNGDYLMQFASKDTFTIYQGTTVDNIDWNKPVRTVSTKSVLLPHYNLSQRYFFGFKNSKGERLVASERLIPMQGASNFRDLGGIPTKDGRVVKWGKFYRSGKLNTMTSQDFQYFNTLDINTVIDFRDDVEVARDVTQLPNEREIERIRTPIGDRSGNMQSQLRKQIKSADQKTFDSEAFVGDVMRQFIDSFAFQYQPFLEIVSDPKKTPLVYHCSAGKDRTGLGTALVLAMLGVEKDVILGDFMMSNYYRNKEINKTLRKSSIVVRPRIVRPLVEVKESYLVTALDAIDKKYGSMENFIEEEYGFTQEKLEAFRNEFLMYNGDNVKVVTKKEAKKEIKEIEKQKKDLEKKEKKETKKKTKDETGN